MTKIITRLSDELGVVTLLTITRWKVHYYLGMKLGFTDVGIVNISMEKYIEDILKEMLDNKAIKTLEIDSRATIMYVENSESAFKIL